MFDGEWRIIYDGVNYTFGTGAHAVFNQTTPDFGDIDIRAADGDRPRADGRDFGVDYFSGRTITFELGVRTTSSADTRAEVEALRSVWRADAVRSVPGAVAELHMQYDGRERVVYGRPRRFAADYADVAVNQFAVVTADFVCVDDLFYGTELHSAGMTTTPQLGGGLLAPLASPLGTTLNSDRSSSISVDTALPAWPIITIQGPITNPVVEIVNVFRVEVQTSLAYDESVVIDARPWRRTAIRNGGSSLGGAVRGTRLSKAKVPTGSHEVVLRGLDATGTARATVQWRSAHSAP